jgi:hypothetical protein
VGGELEPDRRHRANLLAPAKHRAATAPRGCGSAVAGSVDGQRSRAAVVVGLGGAAPALGCVERRGATVGAMGRRGEEHGSVSFFY